MVAADRKGTDSTTYLRRFLREALYREGHLDKLVTLAKADSARTKAEANALRRIEDVLGDIGKVEAGKTRVEETKARQRANWHARQDEIRAFLEREFPKAVASLPDQSRTYGVLADARRIDLIEALRRIVA